MPKKFQPAGDYGLLKVSTLKVKQITLTRKKEINSALKEKNKAKLQVRSLCSDKVFA